MIRNTKFIDPKFSQNLTRPLLCESLFSVVSFCNIVMRNAGIIYYLLFLKYLVDRVKVFVKSVFRHYFPF